MKTPRLDNWSSPAFSTGNHPGLGVELAGHFITNTHATKNRTRDDYLLMYCHRGSGTYQMGHTDVILQAGDCVATFPSIPHTYASDVVDGWEIWWVHFSGDQAERLLSRAGFTITTPVRHLESTDGVLQCFRQLKQVLVRPHFDTMWDASVAVYALLAELAKTATHLSDEDQRFLSVLQEEYATVGEMADAVSMSKEHFIRRFHQLTGVTPGRYLIAAKMRQAKELLAGTHWSIKRIAIALGFSDPNYFSQCFRRETGQTASAFRNQSIL